MKVVCKRPTKLEQSIWLVGDWD